MTWRWLREDVVIAMHGEQIAEHGGSPGIRDAGFLAAYVFLDLNGWELVASEAEALSAVMALAAGEMDEAGFSDWLKDNSLTGTP